eukprot:jgi/Undpi1/5631/HiC_scaffold_2.g00906.m1
MMPTKTWALCALLALATLSTAVRSECDDVDEYFGDVSSVSEIDLGTVIRVDCPANDDGGYLEEILIESGKTLTIKSTQDFVRFVNVRFTVEEGAELIFDMPVTRFGPNSGDNEGGSGYMLDVAAGASVMFTGKFRGSKVDNVYSMFYNTGTIDFKGDTLFINNGNVFRSNLGTLKFRGDSVFKNNRWLALDNGSEDAFVRFSKTATFDNNAGGFDGAGGCGVANEGGTVIFRDDANFQNHNCDEGAAVLNEGKMTFYGKAYFNDNINFRDWGGGVRNNAGTLLFKGAVQFNNNEAEYGGGIAVTGGDVTFNKGVTFDTNGADYNGGAFSLTYGGPYGTPNPDIGPGVMTFKKPEVVRASGNFLVYSQYNDEPVTGCTLGYVEEGTTLVGFDFDDVCVEDTV